LQAGESLVRSRDAPFFPEIAANRARDEPVAGQDLGAAARAELLAYAAPTYYGMAVAEVQAAA
jgi:hypothetical protein